MECWCNGSTPAIAPEEPFDSATSARIRRRMMAKPSAPRWRIHRKRTTQPASDTVLEDYAQRGVELEALVAKTKADAANGELPKWTQQQVIDDLFS